MSHVHAGRRKRNVRNSARARRKQRGAGREKEGTSERRKKQRWNPSARARACTGGDFRAIHLLEFAGVRARPSRPLSPISSFSSHLKLFYFAIVREKRERKRRGIDRVNREDAARSKRQGFTRERAERRGGKGERQTEETGEKRLVERRKRGKRRIAVGREGERRRG